MASITSYNHTLVSQRRTDKALLRQLNRHERLHRMMEDGAISKDSALSFYVDHFKEDRSNWINELTTRVPENERLQGPKIAEYNNDYLDEYFKDYDSD